MIWLLLIFAGCVAVSTQVMRVLPPIARRVACALAFVALTCVLFLRPAGGPHDPMPFLIAFPLCALGFGGIAAEVVEFIGQRRRVQL